MVDGVSREELSGLTPTELLTRFLSWLSSVAGQPIDEAALSRVLVMFIPPLQALGVLFEAEPSADHPYDISQSRSGAEIHGAPLVYLVNQARSLNIEGLPLHPLGLLPASVDDPILKLPSRQGQLDADGWRLYVERSELGRIRGFRSLVEANLAGLAPRMPEYSTLPWRLTVAISPPGSEAAAGWPVRINVDRHAEVDRVVVVQEAGPSFEIGRSRLSYGSVLKPAYTLLERDLTAVLSGRRALGTDDL